jgi:hypothetical protein
MPSTPEKKRLESYRERLKAAREAKSEFSERTVGYDSKMLEKASACLDLNCAKPNDQLLLLHILADVLFRKDKPGRKGPIIWHDAQLMELGTHYLAFKTRHPTYGITKIAKLICETNRFNKYDPAQIRTKLYQLEISISDDEARTDKAIWAAAME